jgi:uroporphyrin-III C-methyltransferase
MSSAGIPPTPGLVIFVGAGPGAADLITVRGARALARAEVVLHDALTDPALRELAPGARWIDVGKRGFCDSTGQTRINALLVQQARRAGVVVRLKGGDPSVFGRLEEELEALAEAGIASEVVPGVTSALAAAAATQRPLTRRGRGRSVSLTTAMTRAGELQATRTADTEVFYMAGRQLAALGRRLREAGWPADTPVSVVSRAGWPDQIGSDHTAGTLAQAALLHSGRPTVVTVGVGAEAVVPAGLTAAATLPQAEAPEPLQVRPVPSAAAAEHMAERMAERIAEPTLMAP